MARLRAWLDPTASSSTLAGMTAALLAVGAVTLLIFPLKHVVATPAALDALYLPVVLSLTAKWGVPVGITGAVFGVLAFDYFHLGPVGSLTALDSDGVVFLTAAAGAIYVATLTGRVRSAEWRRQQEVVARGRVVAAADEERRRVVRDLHNGVQQRLVHAVIVLKLALRALKEGDSEVRGLVDEALWHAEQANIELRELAHGILPSALTRGGLPAGVEALVSRMTLPVAVDVSVERLPPAIEATAYFVVSEALANVTKHARARTASVSARVQRGQLYVEITDDGVGGARGAGPTGLAGLEDRVSALDGRLVVDSAPGKGTRVGVSLPLPNAD